MLQWIVAERAESVRIPISCGFRSCATLRGAQPAVACGFRLLRCVAWPSASRELSRGENTRCEYTAGNGRDRGIFLAQQPFDGHFQKSTLSVQTMPTASVTAAEMTERLITRSASHNRSAARHQQAERNGQEAEAEQG